MALMGKHDDAVIRSVPRAQGPDLPMRHLSPRSGGSNPAHRLPKRLRPSKGAHVARLCPAPQSTTKAVSAQQPWGRSQMTREWSDLVKPMVARCELAAKIGMNATWNPDGAKA